MVASQLALLNQLRTISRYSIAAGILVSVAMRLLGGFGIELQVVLALVALAIGIPHGAVDHLITVPKMRALKMALFMAGYLAIVGVAIFCILAQNTLGFEVVVVMSAIHFGIGDAAFISEIDSRAATDRRFAKWPYALAAGFVPVVIPLVNSESTQALNRVNANLISWDASFAPIFFGAMLVVAALAILVMALMRRFGEVLDLCLLVALALIAPPLVAFAFYFGLWHALRHTGRLTLELPSAEAMHSAGRPAAAFGSAFLAGVPALVLTLGFTLVLGLSRGFSFGQDFLWYLLVVIWALTVPHMALTARIDARAMR